MAAIAISNAPTATLTPCEAQRRKSIQTCLAGLAEARQSSVSAETLKLYSSQLSGYPEVDVRLVCREIAHAARKDGETAFPELGKIVERLEAIRRSHQQKIRSIAEGEKQELWFWQWVDFEMEVTGHAEQEVLDAVRVSGYTGRKARHGT